MGRSLASRRTAAAGAPSPPNPRRRRLRGDYVFGALTWYLSFADYLSLRMICRNWRLYCRRVGRAPPPFPWLMLPQTESPGPATAATVRRLFYDIPGGRTYGYEVPGKAYHRCVATTRGWVVLVAVQPPRRVLLLNPITGAKLIIAWPSGGDKWSDRFHAVLTTSPADVAACHLVLITDRLVAYCRPARAGAGAEGWVTLRAPGFRYHAATSDAVSVGSVVYVVDERRKMWRADLADPEPKVERRDTAFALPPGESSRGRQPRHHLVESLGHVHLVLSDEHHKRVALYKLDWDGRMWAPTDGWRGNRVFLLGRGCSASVPASSAAGRAPGSVLFARQPSCISDSDPAVASIAGGHAAWFWSESRIDAGPNDLIVLKKTVPHRDGEFAGGDSFWFFPATDPDETAEPDDV